MGVLLGSLLVVMNGKHQYYGRSTAKVFFSIILTAAAVGLSFLLPLSSSTLASYIYHARPLVAHEYTS